MIILFTSLGMLKLKKNMKQLDGTKMINLKVILENKLFVKGKTPN